MSPAIIPEKAIILHTLEDILWQKCYNDNGLCLQTQICICSQWLLRRQNPHFHLSHTPLSHTIFRTQLCHTHTPLSHTIIHTQLCHTPSFAHTFVTHHLSHRTLSHTISHTQLCHTPSFTHNFVTHNFVTRNFVAHILSHTTLSHTQFCHTPSLSHPLLTTHTSFQHNFVTHNFVTHTTLSHTIFVTPSSDHTHTPLSNTTLSHTTLSHTTLSHTPCRTQLCHTHLCHTPSFTHTLVEQHFLMETATKSPVSAQTHFDLPRSGPQRCLLLKQFPVHRWIGSQEPPRYFWGSVHLH